MKEFHKFLLKEAATKENVDSQAEMAVNRISQTLPKILGSDYVVQCTFSTKLGKSIHLVVYDKNPAGKIAENSPVFMRFMMFLTDSRSGKEIDLPKVEWEQTTASWKMKEVGLKYRKITSKKSIEDATEKLLAWFKKSKGQMDSLIAAKK